MKTAHLIRLAMCILTASALATLPACTAGNQATPKDASVEFGTDAGVDVDSGQEDAGLACGSETACNGSCTDTTSDPSNCGGCGTVCATGQACSNSVCGTPACTTASSCSSASTCMDNCGMLDSTLCGGLQCSASTACQDTCGLADDTCASLCPNGGVCANGVCSTTACTPSSCSKTTACQDNCGNTNNGCSTGCSTTTTGSDNCGQPNASCTVTPAGGTCVPAGCNAFTACEDTCGNQDNSCPTMCSTTSPGTDNCGMQNSQCSSTGSGNPDGGSCMSIACNPVKACQDNCGNVDNSCFTSCQMQTDGGPDTGLDNCGQNNPVCVGYAQVEVHRSDAVRKHTTVPLEDGASQTVPFRWHDAPGLAAPADLSVEMGGKVLMQISSVSARPFLRAGFDASPIEADVTYRLGLDRHGNTVTLSITRDGSAQVLFQSEAHVATDATITDLVLAESFRRIAVTLNP